MTEAVAALFDPVDGVHLGEADEAVVVGRGKTSGLACEAAQPPFPDSTLLANKDLLGLNEPVLLEFLRLPSTLYQDGHALVCAQIYEI